MRGQVGLNQQDMPGVWANCAPPLDTVAAGNQMKKEGGSSRPGGTGLASRSGTYPSEPSDSASSQSSGTGGACAIVLSAARSLRIIPSPTWGPLPCVTTTSYPAVIRRAICAAVVCTARVCAAALRSSSMTSELPPTATRTRGRLPPLLPAVTATLTAECWHCCARRVVPMCPVNLRPAGPTRRKVL